MDRRIVALIVFIILVMAGMQLVLGLLRGEREEVRGAPVQSFEFDDERVLHISGAIVYPVRRPRLGLFYRIESPEAQERERGDEPGPAVSDAPQQPPEHFFATLPPERQPPAFVAHVSDDGAVVGVAAASDPDGLLILHDFERDESWPRRTEVETREDLEPRAARLFARLKHGLPEDEGERLRLVEAEDIRPLERLIRLPAPEPAPPSE